MPRTAARSAFPSRAIPVPDSFTRVIRPRTQPWKRSSLLRAALIASFCASYVARSADSRAARERATMSGPRRAATAVKSVADQEGRGMPRQAPAARSLRPQMRAWRDSMAASRSYSAATVSSRSLRAIEL